ncbi:16S rRNA (cytosine(967)-C(5))-methyltransferase RsmB [Rhodoferax sp.]|uniref:16S rRNA (cytosine(967)-C(5))-methyltransferase RsmB n=1 Tax=Rhodoferax sp. TaxID=50421 RepID=UPI002ACE2635|nr:16S rRNA (cytosine(967)-C(5))-methyltransferase RsmB [Rhodoferax sp.]MDZ7919299.1 16S rRNA (cytosine(967)-C(5))-methyltransferase RsmB [Rhodoferax sp.]
MNQSVNAPPLWKQLQQVARVNQAVMSGASGTSVLETVDPGLRSGVQALCFYVWRNWGRAQALRALLVRKAPPPLADALLCSALALTWQIEDNAYDAFTLVNQAVEAAKRQSATNAQANFINACLRRFLRERDALVAATDLDPVALWNHPRWWIARLQKDHPQHWELILRAANQHAPMTLRVNPRRKDPQTYLGLLQAAGMNGQHLSANIIELQRAAPVQAIPGFEDGWVSVQDAAAQVAAPLLVEGYLAPGPWRILDACAAPGGKTGHLLEITDAEVVALEVDADRAKRIGSNVQRLGLSPQVIVADAGAVQTWWDGSLFDLVLLDAPCTASGIVRRHPDIRWLRRESDVAQLAATQRQLLLTLWPLVKPGGRLLFCTCSIFRAEGDAQVQAFLVHNTDAALMPSPGHLLPHSSPAREVVADNSLGDHDGFFYALFEKRKA